MRRFIDISAAPFLVTNDLKKMTYDGEVYPLKWSKYKEHASSISRKELLAGTALILTNKNGTKFIFTYEDDPTTTRERFSNIKYIGEVITKYLNGEQRNIHQGGGYLRSIK